MPEYWALAGYPPSAAWLQRVSAGLDGPLQITTLGELRALGAARLVGRVRSVRADVGLLLEEGGATPLTPALLALLALTRCRSLEAVSPDGGRRRLSRARALVVFARMVGATLRGLAAAVRCALELRSLRNRRPEKLPETVRRVSVLRTNLWHGIKAGGSVGHFAGVVNALARRGIAVDIFAPEEQPMIDAGVPIHVVPSPGHPAYPYELNYYRYHRRFVDAVAARLGRNKPDLLYHRISLGAWAGAAIGRRLDIPVIAEYNGSEVWVSRHWGRGLRFERLAAAAERTALRAADLVTVVSAPLADEVRAHGVPDERIVVHPNGVDTDLFDPARFSTLQRLDIRRGAGIPADATVCTFVGTFGRWHGVEVLAAAIRSLSADHAWMERHRVRFLLIGDGAMMPLARRELGELADVVTFAGLRPQHETPGWLAASDILLSPHVPNPDGTRFFGSPTKLFEYMAMERPIVASALEQIADVLTPAFQAADLPSGSVPVRVDDRIAVVSTPGNVEEFAKGLRFVIEHPEVRPALGANARAAAQRRYTWEANVAALLDRCRQLGRTK